MKRILIFCEGVTDQIFIADCLEVFYGFNTNRKDNSRKTINGIEERKKEIKFSDSATIEGEVIDVGGCSKLVKQEFLHSMMADNTELEGINIVIFDADYTKKDSGNKGFDACSHKLTNIQKRKNINFESYIWPNNKEDGEIEDLLRQLIPIHKECIFNCIEAHQSCLKSLGIENLRYADLKEKISFYLYTSSIKSESRIRDYKDNNVWHLLSNENEDLNAFKSFLHKIITLAQVP